jgi:hypothetical protein
MQPARIASSPRGRSCGVGTTVVASQMSVAASMEQLLTKSVLSKGAVSYTAASDLTLAAGRLAWPYVAPSMLVMQKDYAAQTCIVRR